jgi:hypothetical protein
VKKETESRKSSEKSLEMSLNLKQVKGNFQRLFDKNLTDLVRGLRNNKDNEVSEVSSNQTNAILDAF